MRERERIRSVPCKVLIKVSASLHRSISTDPCRVMLKDGAYAYVHAGTSGLCMSVFLREKCKFDSPAP